MSDYAAFLSKKSQLGNASGFDPAWMPEFLFPFQRHLVEWACRQGRAAIFADCGLGKTDERHMHPLQLDVIERVVVLRSNPGETVLTPFMGVGSEVYGAVTNGRRGIGIELKQAYYRQAVRNLEAAAQGEKVESLFSEEAEPVESE